MNEADIREAFSEIWRTSLESESTSDDADFFDSGGTSIQAVHLAALVQERFEIEFDALEVVVARSAGAMIKIITDRLAEAAGLPGDPQ
ncbi:acyl carrier protein [Streptomyces caeruleatus]|jgi:acyl carrier protein|uniref:Carrier domain-containing protein n=1 Tax=Streptomyces caeruleatus TaxID=661399 RepID=A0A101TNP2_9ACTN|nr:acyl carrier protein [Streptomyces caeruleatus]KUN95690.1 hypothetical protein AQJ67_34600 [Streptomyces caeruleatus]